MIHHSGKSGMQSIVLFVIGSHFICEMAKNLRRISEEKVLVTRELFEDKSDNINNS